MVPYSYIIIKIKRIPKEMTGVSLQARIQVVTKSHESPSSRDQLNMDNFTPSKIAQGAPNTAPNAHLNSGIWRFFSTGGPYDSRSFGDLEAQGICNPLRNGAEPVIIRRIALHQETISAL